MPARAGKKNASLREQGGVGLEFMCNRGRFAALRGHARSHKSSECSRFCGSGRAREGSQSGPDTPNQASTRIDVPVISTGFSSPSSFSMVGATSASTPPSRTLTLRLPT